MFTKVNETGKVVEKLFGDESSKKGVIKKRVGINRTLAEPIDFDLDEDGEETKFMDDESNQCEEEERSNNCENNGNVDKHDPLDEIIQFKESIESGIYTAKITSVREVKNGNIMVSFSTNVENQFYYPLVAFFPRVAIKGNPTYRLFNSFKGERMTFNKLVNKMVHINVSVVNKNGRIFENITDFESINVDVNTLDVDKYGRFID